MDIGLAIFFAVLALALLLFGVLVLIEAGEQEARRREVKRRLTEWVG